MPPADDLLGDLLRQVSRSFYLSLAVLPRSLREPVSLAYLLARAADTIADTRLIGRNERIVHLETLRKAYGGAVVDLAAVATACAPGQTHAAERRLLERLPEARERLAALPPADLEPTRAVLATLTSGMLFDLATFPGEDRWGLGAIADGETLERYTYLVAGCVGEFWTTLHIAHRPRLAGWNVAAMSTDGIRFGQALQLTNVLRDVPRDVGHGRCYLPARDLAALGLGPHDLLEPDGRRRARPILDQLIARALAHYDAAWRYTLAIPRAEWRMRLACVWPLGIGLSTLAALSAHDDPLGAEPPVKIPRAEVQRILVRSAVEVWSNGRLAATARRLRGRVLR
jgi:farnesyl-diphosphate farnesyltransferase